MQFNLAIITSLLAAVVQSASIQGQIHLPTNITVREVERTAIQLSQVDTTVQQSTLLKRHAYLKHDNSFEFKGIKDGEYVLNLGSLDYNLAPNLVKITVVNDEVKVYLLEHGASFDSSVSISHPISIKPLEGKPLRQYVKGTDGGILEIEPIKTIVGNPLYLGITVVLIVLGIAPLIWEMFDPEVAEISRKHREGGTKPVATEIPEKDDKLNEVKEKVEVKQKAEVIEENKKNVQKKGSQAKKRKN